MDCPKCGGKMEMFVSIRLRLPAEYMNLISKSVIRKKDCKITAAYWDSARVVCYNCKYSDKGF